MGEDRAVSSPTGSFSQGRPQTDPQPPLFGGYSLGFAQRRSLEGFAQGGISLSLDLLAPTPVLGRNRSLDASLEGVSGGTGRPGVAGLVRNLRRRQFCSGEKRGPGVGKTKRGKGTKWMVVVDGQGIPLGKLLDSATPAEVTLIEPLLETISVPRKGPGRPKSKPKRLIYDKAADSDELRIRLAKRGIDLICPHRRNRVRPSLQDGRKLRRYRRRWIIERTNAWLGAFRRLVVRYEHSLMMYNAFFNVACMMIVLRQL